MPNRKMLRDSRGRFVCPSGDLEPGEEDNLHDHFVERLIDEGHIPFDAKDIYHDRFGTLVYIDGWGRKRRVEGVRRRAIAAPPPPPPPKPEQWEIERYMTAGLTTKTYHSSVPFQTMEDLLKGVQRFSQGGLHALSDTVHDIGESSGGLGAMMAMIVLGDGVDGFTSRLLKNIEAGLKSDKRFFHGDWDYDGPGPFHKCTLEARGPYGGAPFSLHIHAARVGNEPELRLAKTLDIRPGLGYVELIKSYMPDGDTFRVPMSEIKAILDGIREFAETANDVVTLPTVEEVVQTLITPQTGRVDMDNIHTAVTLVESTMYNAVLNFDSYSLPMNFDRRDEKAAGIVRDYTIRVEGDFIVGPARAFRNKYTLEKPQTHETTRLDVTIRSPYGNPCFVAESKMRMVALGETLRRVWG